PLQFWPRDLHAYQISCTAVTNNPVLPQYRKHILTINTAEAAGEQPPAVAIAQREAPTLVQRAATAPAAALPTRVAKRVGDLGRAHRCPSSSLRSDGTLTMVRRPTLVTLIRRSATNL